MPRRLFTSILFLAFCLITTAAVGEEAPQLSEDVDQRIRELVDAKHYIGVAVGLVGPGGESFYSYGTTRSSGGDPISEDSLFEIGSITKVFTSIVLADMVRRDSVKLDEPLAALLPDEVGLPESAREIHLLDLATHVSGLPRMPSNFKPADPANPFADYTVEQIYEFLSSYELPRDVGAQYEYSNYGAGLLGHVLALKAGEPYETLVKRTVADELGMKSTVVTLTPELRTRLAKGHGLAGEVPNWDIPTLAGAGALRSTARDMVTFLAANLELGESFLHEAMKMTHTPRRDAMGKHRVALGWHVRVSDELSIVWHNGGTGGYRSFAGFDAARKLGVVVLTNTFHSVDQLGFHILDASVPIPELPKRPKKKPLFNKKE